MKYLGLAFCLGSLGAILSLTPAWSQPAADPCDDAPTVLGVVCEEARELLLTDLSDDGAVLHISRAQDGWHYTFGASSAETACPDPGPLTLPQGQTLVLHTTASDDLYEFSVPDLVLDLTLIPGRVDATTIDATEEGHFPGILLDMEGTAIAGSDPSLQILPPTAFAAWQQEVASRTC